jgi:hypothetical protein
MKKILILTILCVTKISVVLAGNDISSTLKNSLLCKNFDKTEADYTHNKVYKNYTDLLDGITKSSTLSSEFKEKFAVYDKFSGRSGGTITFVPVSDSTLKFVYLSLYLESKPTLNTEYTGDILEFAEDFRKKNPNTNLEYMSQSKIIKYLKEENGFNQLEEISFSAEISKDEFSKTQNNTKYYSKHLFYAYPKGSNNSSRMTVFYTDPLNEKIINVQCFI